MKWLFWASVFLIAYTYVGYMVWLWLRAWLRPWPVQRGKCEPDVSIVMVVRNEERVLEDKIRNLLELDYPPDRCQIVVVSDGSTDRTEAILHKYGTERRFTSPNDLKERPTPPDAPDPKGNSRDLDCISDNLHWLSAHGTNQRARDTLCQPIGAAAATSVSAGFS